MTPAEKLLAALSDIRDEWVEDAAPDGSLPGSAPSPKRPAARTVWLRWGSLAACAVLVCFAGYRLGRAPDSTAAQDTALSSYAMEEDAAAGWTAEDPQEKSTVSADAVDGLHSNVGTATDLPLLTVSPEDGDMGYEGYLAYDAGELGNGNPWLAAGEAERAALSALPVYRTKNWNGMLPLALSEEELYALARQTADALGDTIAQQTSTTVAPGNKGTGLPGDAVYCLDTVTAGGWAIEVYGDGTVTVWPGEKYGDSGLALPARYSFTYSDTSPEQAAETLDYLLERFADFAGLQSPAHALFADRNIYGEPVMTYAAYEGGGTLAEQIVAYNLRQVSFAPNDDGALMLMRRYDFTAGAELLGDYPLLTAEEARALLLAGNYLSSVPYDLPGEEAIVRVELVYRTGETVMPYYRFLAELPEEAAGSAAALGLKDYGAYYVPAVRSEYLTELPVWDGSFN